MSRRQQEALRRAEPLVDLFDDSTLLTVVLRVSLLENAYLGDVTRFKASEHQALERLDSGMIEASGDRATLLEGLGRGRALLELPAAHVALNEAESCALVAAMPLRMLQVMRSKLIMLTKQDAADRDYAEYIARELVHTAREHGHGQYKRYLRQTKMLARELQIEDRLGDVLHESD